MHVEMLIILILFSVCRITVADLMETKVKVLKEYYDQSVAVSVSTNHFADSMLACVRLCRMDEEWSFNYDADNKVCYCHTGLEPRSDHHTTPGVVFGYPLYVKETRDNGKSHTRSYPRYFDCLDLYEHGFRMDGVYEINPPDGIPFKAWCDQENGGWTVIQRRVNGLVNFNRSWSDYVNGFGILTHEYWLGMEKIVLLTKHSSSLKIDMYTFGDVASQNEAFALYDTFSLIPAENFRLVVDGFHGDCGDSLSYHNRAQFSTYDRDNDNTTTACNVNGGGGWWYVSCYWSNLNGPYRQYSLINYSVERGISWYSCWTHDISLRNVVMKVKRNH
ncbi:Angiopoietin-related protein 5 [Mactra antiquata]